jgi:hypothetical protein
MSLFVAHPSEEPSFPRCADSEVYIKRIAALDEKLEFQKQSLEDLQIERKELIDLIKDLNAEVSSTASMSTATFPSLSLL